MKTIAVSACWMAASKADLSVVELGGSKVALTVDPMASSGLTMVALKVAQWDCEEVALWVVMMAVL